MKGWHNANMAGKEIITRELLEACKVALNSFRQVYDGIKAGLDVDDLFKDETYWPLDTLRAVIAKTEGRE